MTEDYRIDQRDQTIHGSQTNIGKADKVIIQESAKFAPPFPHQIPLPPRDFSGREDELNELISQFDRGATITGLRGMGGIGKTALALVLADRIKDRFPDGQLFLDMLGTSKSPLKPEDAMAHVIRSYIGAENRLPSDLNSLGGLYRTVLSEKSTLILLDNATNREQVEPLLPPDGSALLITSRNKFALPGLNEKDLDVLPLEDSKKLLLEIAERIGSRTEEMARLCGCLPIALRNAAYTMAERKDLRVEEYLNRLKDAQKRLELVEASFSLSYELLSPERQRLWCMLSVFPADFDRKGATAVWGLDPDSVADAMSDLFKLSLVEYQEASGRYHLHDLARDFAASQLETGAKADAQQRHVEHYLNVLSSAKELYKQGNEGVLAGLELFDIEETNIRAGQAWAKKNLAGSSSAAALCSAYAAAGVYVLDLRLNPWEQIGWLEAALAAARQLKDGNMEGVHLGNLGLAYAALGAARKAIDYYEQSLAIAHETGDKRSAGNALGNMGLAYCALGDARKAIDYYEQSLVIHREIGDRRGEGNDLCRLGMAYYSLGAARKAINYYEQALAIAREIGDRQNEGACLGNMGLAYVDLGAAHRAIDYYVQHLAIAREIGDRRGEGAGLGNLGNAYYSLGDARKAIDYYERCLTIHREVEDRQNEGNDLGNLGNAYYSLEDVQMAIDYYNQRLYIAREIGDRRGEGNALGNLGNVYYSLEDVRKAIDYYEQSLAIAREIGDRQNEGTWQANLGNAYADLGDVHRAIDLIKDALTIFEQIESPSAEHVCKLLTQLQGVENPK